MKLSLSYYRETVFGLCDTPYIAVHHPENHGREGTPSPWSRPDALSSWSFDVAAGSPVTVDVYSDADEVELVLDGSSLGRITVGQEKAYLARFGTAYHPGVLTSIAYHPVVTAPITGPRTKIN